MSTLIARRATIVWLGLVVATLLTFWLGTDHATVGGDARIAPAAAIVIAFVKIHFVGQDFMELRGAHLALRAVFGAWTVGVCLAVTLLYVI